MKIDVKHIAKLANIPLSKEKEEEIEKALETTLKHVDNLQKINTDNVLSTNQVTMLENVFREDEVKPSFSQQKAIMNAKRTYKGFFVVPAVLEQ